MLNRPLKRRRGTVPIEMAMCFPIIIILTAWSIWQGIHWIKKAEVVVEAKTAADSARYGASERSINRATAKPFDFSEHGLVQSDVEKTVDVFGITPVTHPSSTYAVLDNCWDYRSVDLNKQPNFQLMIDLARKGPPNEVRGRIEDIGLLMDDLKRLSADLGSLFDVSSMFDTFSPGYSDKVSGANSSVVSEAARSAIQNAVATKVSELFEGNEEYKQARRLIDQINGTRDQVANKQNERQQELDQKAKNFQRALQNIDLTEFSRPIDALRGDLRQLLDSDETNAEEFRREVENRISKALPDQVEKLLDDAAKVIDGVVQKHSKDVLPVELKIRPEVDLKRRLRDRVDNLVDDLPDLSIQEIKERLREIDSSVFSIRQYFQGFDDARRNISNQIDDVRNKGKDLRSKANDIPRIPTPP